MREPDKVEWDLMVGNLLFHGCKLNSVLYYLNPTKEALDRLISMLAPEQVEELIHDHEDLKLCDLYIMNADFWSCVVGASSFINTLYRIPSTAEMSELSVILLVLI